MATTLHLVKDDTITRTLTPSASVIDITTATGKLFCDNDGTVTTITTTGHTATTVDVAFDTLLALAITRTTTYKCELELIDGTVRQTFPENETTDAFFVTVRPDRGDG